METNETVARQAVAAALKGSATFEAYGFKVVPGDAFVIRHLDGTEFEITMTKREVPTQ